MRPSWTSRCGKVVGRIIKYGVPLIWALRAETLTWPGWQVPAEAVDEKGGLTIVQDEQAESKRGEERVALVRHVSRRAIAKSALEVALAPPVDLASLQPGLYRVSARVKFDGDVCIIGTPIQLHVKPVYIERSGDRIATRFRPSPTEAAEQAFYGYEFEESGKYKVLSFLYEVDPTGKKRLLARRAVSPMAMFSSTWARPEQPQPDQPNLPRGIVAGITLPRTKHSSASGMPPNSVRTVSVDWLKLERVDATPPIAVRYVRPAKHWLRPGEKTGFDVGLENGTAEAQKRKFKVSLTRSYDERLAIHEEEIELAPGELRTFSIPWQTKPDAPLWGYEVRAEILSGGKTEAWARDFFSIHPEAYAVHVMGSNFRTRDPFRDRENSANLLEMFGATPGDCARATSPHEQWLGGMMEVPYSYEATRNAVRHNAAMGVQTVMYLFAGGTGTAVMDLYIKKPEWFSDRMYGTDVLYRKLRQIEETVQNFDFKKDVYETPMTPHVELGMNYWDPVLMERVTQDTLAFLRKSDYGGIRFDVGLFSPKSATTCYGEKLPYDMKDAMSVAARNFESFCSAMRKEFPTFEFGANMDSWAYLENVGKRNQEPPDPESYPEFVAFARAGGMFMDEGTMNAPFFGHYMNRFEDALWSMCRKREMARRYGGIYQLFSPHRDGTGYFAHDDIYWTIMIVASGSYYVGSFSAIPYSDDSAGEFIVRFSEFFRKKTLKPIPDAAEKIIVDAPSDVWYAETAVWEDIGDRRRYVIPLINPPVNERLRRNKTNELPQPIRDPFDIRVAAPEGYGKARAWMLTWEPSIAAAPLAATVEGKAVRVTLPGIQLFRTLVVEFEK